MEKKLDIYKMELHQEFYINKSDMIMRVSGGWIYKCFSCGIPLNTFVPYDLEFCEPKK